jgi:hypothetical protein
MTFLQKLRSIYYRNSDASNYQWTPVPGFERGYEMTRNGFIRSKSQRYLNKILPRKLGKNGYYYVKLNHQGIQSSLLLHRLIAIAYVANPEGKRCVNHLNGIKTDIRPENLEWSTHQENVLHAYRTGLISRESQMKMVINTCTGESYKSIKEAAEALSIPYSTCRNYLNGTRPNATCLRLAA